MIPDCLGAAIAATAAWRASTRSAGLVWGCSNDSLGKVVERGAGWEGLRDDPLTGPWETSGKRGKGGRVRSLASPSCFETKRLEGAVGDGPLHPATVSISVLAPRCLA